MKHSILSILLILASSLFVSAQGITFTGQVVDVLDGQTFVLETPRSRITVRLQYIDAPDKSQSLYDTVKDHLTTLIKGKTVTVQMQALSRNVTIGRGWLNGIDLSRQLLRDGAAWYSVPDADRQTVNDRNSYQEMERMARDERRGIWGIPDLTPAWQIRVEREKAEQARKEAEQKELLAKIARSGLPSTPTLGMTYTELIYLCGSEPNDFLSFDESEKGAKNYASLKFTRERANNLCFGRFTFNDGRLSSISRDSADIR